MGFGVPIDRWLRNELKDLTYDIMLENRTIQRGLFRREAVQLLIDEHMAKHADHSYRIWTLLFLELWYRMFIDKTSGVGNLGHECSRCCFLSYYQHQYRRGGESPAAAHKNY